MDGGSIFFTMDYLWITYELPMDYLWITYDINIYGADTLYDF